MDEEERGDTPERCAVCGYAFERAKDRYESFRTDGLEEDLGCPHCEHQKHFGVLHSE